MNKEGVGEGHNSVHSRGTTFKIFNKIIQTNNKILGTGINLSEQMLVKSGQMSAGLVHSNRISALSFWPVTNKSHKSLFGLLWKKKKISTVHKRDCFCYVVHGPKM